MNDLFKQISKQVTKIQREFGAGFQENILQAALAKEFLDAKIEYEKELNLDIIYKGSPIGSIRADFYIPKQTKHKTSEDLIIETKQAPLVTKPEQLSQLKIYLKSRQKHLGKKGIAKAMLIHWENRDSLNESEDKLTFSTDIKVEVWEISKNSKSLNKIWSSINGK
jgi:GxxExxY protein